MKKLSISLTIFAVIIVLASCSKTNVINPYGNNEPSQNSKIDTPYKNGVLKVSPKVDQSFEAQTIVKGDTPYLPNNVAIPLDTPYRR